MRWHILIGAVIFLIPTNWFLKLTETFQYLAGNRVDYLIPKVYPLELIVAVAVLLLLSNRKRAQNLVQSLRAASPVWLGMLGVGIVWQLFSPRPVLAISWLLKLSLLALLVWLIGQHKKLLQSTSFKKTLLFALIGTILFQSAVTLWQFWTQGSVFGYWFLGETDLNYFANISKVSIQGREYIAAYGTTAHPNILAGILAVYLPIVVLLNRIIKNTGITKTLSLLALGLGGLSLLLTFSISGWLTLGTCSAVMLAGKHTAIKKYQRISGGLLVASGLAWWGIGFTSMNSTQLSISRRITLTQAALHMWLAQPFFGAGLGQFTLFLEKFSATTEVVRFLQPVHHVGLLWLAETGVWGLALLWKARRYLLLAGAALLPALSLDHYWLTQYNALVLFALVPLFATRLAMEEY